MKVLLAVKGQCNPSMKNELETVEECGNLEKNDNTVGSLKMIKELSHLSTEVKCQHQSMMTILWKPVNVCQGDTETMVGHCKRFMNAVDIVEGLWERHTWKRLQRTSWTAMMMRNIKRRQTSAVTSFWLACLCMGKMRNCTRNALVNQITCV